ncbi:MAG: hypothetical protein QOI06_2318 [Nocardioidaceae bacterium]|jgi:hypothetical protein|nr:hypothetical protein [Nocardioidaceae bacterium]
MATQLTFDADLQFSVDIPGSPPVTGTLTGSGTALELRVSSPAMFTGRSDAGALRGLAQALADKGLAISVVSPAGPVATLGVERTSWWQRRATGSRHIRLERGAGLWSLIRSRSLAPRGGVLPGEQLAPPPTLLPVAPTMRRRPRRPVTTTHDPHRGGNPRLTQVLGPYARQGEHPRQFPLHDDVTTIGSDPGCDIRLPGLEPLHAEIRHDEADEFVLVRIARAASIRVHGAPVDVAILRTGARVDLGQSMLSYFREEYADHGRPYGGRIGGELGHQRSQPSREELQRQVAEQ